MTEWNVYSVGGLDFLYNVFNAVAMLMNAGTFADMFRIAALIGVIGVVIASALSGGKTLSFQNMGVCVVIYMLFFQVSARVNIEDVTNGNFKAVDNVPAGLAGAASIISTVGYLVTEKMEQAFSTPQMTEYGALDPLIAMSTLYDSMKDPMRWAQDSSLGTRDLQRSIANYMQTCVTNDIIRGTTTFANLYKNSTGVAGLASSDAFQRVTIFDSLGANWTNSAAKSSANESIYPCNVAYDKIVSQMNASTGPLQSAFNTSYAALGRTCSGVACAGTTKIQEVMNFYNIQSTDLRDFQLTMIMYPYLRDIPVYGYQNSFRGTAAVTRAQTMTQQAFQWASSGSSFLSWMSSFMPIFQGLIYALAPFMAFLIGIGPMGLKLIMKYLLVVVWTQTWMPLAAIVNLYVLTSTQTTMESILAGTPALTFNQLYSILAETQKSIGLAGNLYSMIPALAGFIVWGSAVAFNSLANSAAAPHAADTKPLTPDVTNAPAINSRLSDSNYSIAEGTTAVGTGNRVASFSVQDVASRNLSSAKQELSTASQSLQASRGAMFSEVASNMSSGGSSNVSSDAFNNAFSQLSSADRSAVQDTARKHGISTQEAIVQMNNGSISLGAGASAGEGFTASANGSIGRTQAESREQNARGGTEFGNSDASRLSEGTSNQTARIVSSMAQHMSSELSQSGNNTAATSAYQAAYARQESASKNFQEAEQFSQTSSMSQTLRADYIGNTLSNDEHAQRAMNQILSGHTELNREVSDNAARLQSVGMTEENATAAAKFMAVASLGQAGEIGSNLGFTQMGGRESPVLTPDAAGENRGVAGGAEGAGNNINSISGNVNAGAQGARSDASARINNEGHIASPENAEPQVAEWSDTGRGAVHSANESHNSEVHVKQANRASENLENTSYRSAGVLGSLHEIGDSVSNAFSHNPTFENQYDRAKDAAASVPGISEDKADARDAIARYAAATKAGGDAGSDSEVAQAREDMIARIQLATGGEARTDGTVDGGNLRLAQGVAARLENDARDPKINGDNTVIEAVTALNTTRGGTSESSYGAAGQELGGVHHNYNVGGQGTENLTNNTSQTQSGPEDTMLVSSGGGAQTHGFSVGGNTSQSGNETHEPVGGASTPLNGNNDSGAENVFSGAGQNNGGNRNSNNEDHYAKSKSQSKNNQEDNFVVPSSGGRD